MSKNGLQLDRLKNAPGPWLFFFDWPEPVGVNPDSIRAAIYSGAPKKLDRDGLIVREDGRFLGLTDFGNFWRVTSGDFIGEGSTVAAQLVRIDMSGRSILPKKGVLRMLPGNNGAKCTWQEALETALHFAGFGGMPSGLGWWHGEENL